MTRRWKFGAEEFITKTSDGGLHLIVLFLWQYVLISTASMSCLIVCVFYFILHIMSHAYDSYCTCLFIYFSWSSFCKFCTKWKLVHYITLHYIIHKPRLVYIMLQNRYFILLSILNINLFRWIDHIGTYIQWRWFNNL